MYRVILATVLLCLPYPSFAAKPPKPVDQLEARVETLEAEVTELKARPGPVQVLANGESIGSFLGIGNTNNLGQYITLSSTGYMFQVFNMVPSDHQPFPLLEVGRIWPETLLFEFADCLGQAFIELSHEAGRPLSADLIAAEGIVVATGDPLNGVFYAPEGSQAAFLDATFFARSLEGSCGSSPRMTWVVPVFPNDPAITGVPNEPFTPPIKLGQ